MGWYLVAIHVFLFAWKTKFQAKCEMNQKITKSSATKGKKYDKKNNFRVLD